MQSQSLRARLQAHYHRHYARVGKYWRSQAGFMRPATRRRYRRSFARLLQCVPPGGRILDLGCGTGVMLSWLCTDRPDLCVVGVDVSEPEIEAARQALRDHSNVEIYCDDGACFLERHKLLFSGIFCFDVLEHVPEEDLLRWMEAIRSAIIPGGFFCCRAPNAAHLFGSYVRYMDLTHVRAFTGPSLLQLLEASGFVNCEILHFRSGSIVSALQVALEYLLHRALFLVCGHPQPEVFTSNVHAVGWVDPHSAKTGPLPPAPPENQ